MLAGFVYVVYHFSRSCMQGIFACVCTQPNILNKLQPQGRPSVRDYRVSCIQMTKSASRPMTVTGIIVN